jgi:hypothetical protein
MSGGGADAVDILAFGPHPDDLEIGVGGTLAKHATLGDGVGLCDLTAGEMGSNGTVEERLAEAEAARAVLGARWRVNLRLPDRGIGSDLSHVRVAAELVRRARPRVVAVPHWSDRHPVSFSLKRSSTPASGVIPPQGSRGNQRRSASISSMKPDSLRSSWTSAISTRRSGARLPATRASSGRPRLMRLPHG